MAQRSKFLIAALVALVGGAIAVAIVSASSQSGGGNNASAAAAGFNPKTLKGKWTGEWENLTFGSRGDVLTNVKFRGGKFIPMTDFSGNIFGCPDPPADSVTLKEGNGKNRWNEDGFKIDTNSKALGHLTASYDHDTNKVKAKGDSPCDDSTTFTAKGRLTKSKFNVTVDISLASGTAKAKVTSKKD